MAAQSKVLSKKIMAVHIPLCVDLDGTIIKTDSLFESFLLLFKKNPLNIFLCLVWLCKGRSYLKYKVAIHTNLNPQHLPYSQQFLSFLQQEHAKGRQILLVTAADNKIAKQIADYLGIFSEVISSDENKNLKGKHKRDILDQRFGKKGYDYAGNDKADLAIWANARRALIVNAKPGLLRKSKRIAVVEQTFSDKKNSIRAFLNAIRIHQYVKNILLFIPLLVGHLYFNIPAIINTFAAFVVFCLVASSVYLLNDLLDLEADRQHRTKNQRAFAAGNLSIATGLITIALFLIAATTLSLWLPFNFQLAIVSYYLLTIAYSFYLKRKLLVDVFVLAILYTLRIIAGMAVLDVEYSQWLLSFSLFLFLSLAFVKRYSELHFSELENKAEIIGRGYLVADLPQLRLFGTVSGYISILVFALYINSNKVMTLYRSPMLLWLICLILLYWISRMWILATRGVMHEDPVMFALKDRVSWLVMFAVGLIGITATYLN